MGIATALIVASRPLLATASARAAGSPDLTGQWTLHNSIAGNESDEDCTFSQEDTKLAGDCKAAEQKVKVTGGIDGKKLTFKYDVEYQGTMLTLTYNATLDDPDNIAGTVDVQPYDVSGEFTAKRAKAAK
jgi:hypothetical protein